MIIQKIKNYKVLYTRNNYAPLLLSKISKNGDLSCKIVKCFIQPFNFSRMIVDFFFYTCMNHILCCLPFPYNYICSFFFLFSFSFNFFFLFFFFFFFHSLLEFVLMITVLCLYSIKHTKKKKKNYAPLLQLTPATTTITNTSENNYYITV